MQCKCGSEMHLQARIKIADGITWRCSSHQCRKIRSVKSGTVFEASKFELKQCILIYTAWNAYYKIYCLKQKICLYFKYL